MNIRSAWTRTTLLLATFAFFAGSQLRAAPPNFVVIFADDLGWGDLGCYGHPTINTPNLDAMAAEGMKFTSFYSASPVCTPSRAALMTGRLPGRSGMCSDTRRVLFPDSKLGIPAKELTIPELLADHGYASACIGKWHLGHLPPYLPTSNGFDQYLGIPYSNDMDRIKSAPRGRAAFLDPKTEYWNVPLMRNEAIVERPADQTTITKRYTEAAVKFIREQRDRPFFLYMPHSLPHVPLFRSADFASRSRRGLYGDVIEEIDWSVGKILQTLRDLELDENTLVMFTSDNGPWLIFDEQGGSAGLLRGGKGSTWEGGMRVPGLAWWPKHIQAGSVCRDAASTMDILPTVCELAGIAPPSDRALDGVSLAAAMKSEETNVAAGAVQRDAYYYYRGYQLMAVRVGPWKAHLKTQAGYGQPKPELHDPPLLFHLEHDPSERFNVADQHPEALKQITAAIDKHLANWKPAPSQLEAKIGQAQP